jgi:hypothetical protein
MAMSSHSAADRWVTALLPFPSVYDGRGNDRMPGGSPGQRATHRRSDGSIDDGRYAREAGRLDGEWAATTIQAVLATARRALTLRRGASRRAHRTPGS